MSEQQILVKHGCLPHPAECLGPRTLQKKKKKKHHVDIECLILQLSIHMKTYIILPTYPFNFN